MSQVEQTLQTCKGYLLRDPHVKRCFEKLDVSSSRGFMYEYEHNGHSIFMDLHVDEALPLITLFAHGDVLVKKEKAVLAAKYCQLKSSPWEPGLLVFSASQRRVFYQITTPFIEAPLSEQTLAWMNSCACNKLVACHEDLVSIAYDDLTLQWNNGEKDKETDLMQFTFPMKNFQETKAQLGKELQDMRRNALGQNINDEEATLFFSQIMTKDMLFHEEITVDQSGCLILAIHSELKVSEEHLGRIARYCNQSNSSRKLAGMHACSRDGYLWFSAPISLWDGVIGSSSIGFVELFGLAAIHEALDTIQSWDWNCQEDIEADCFNDDSKKDEEGPPTRERHISHREAMDILRGIHANHQEPEFPGSPESGEDDPFSDIFGGAAPQDEQPDPDMSILGDDGIWPGFESFFLEKDGQIPWFVFPSDGEDGIPPEVDSPLTEDDRILHETLPPVENDDASGEELPKDAAEGCREEKNVSIFDEPEDKGA